MHFSTEPSVEKLEKLEKLNQTENQLNPLV